MAVNGSHSLSRRRVAACLALCLGACLVGGCATTDWALSSSGPKSPAICTVVASWNKEVVHTPDPVNNGKMSPGIAGRIHLFGADLKYPQLGDGSLVVEMYGDGPKEKDPPLLERWVIDPVTLKRLEKRDMVGMGYTLYLPWTRVEPDVTRLGRVKLRVRYQPAQGSPLFTEGSLVLGEARGSVPIHEGGPPMKFPQMQARR